MIGILVVSHGKLAEAMISSARNLVGNLPKIAAISIDPKDHPNDVKARIGQKITEMDEGDGVVLLTDLSRGTRTHLSLPILSEKVEAVTGVNLPLLLTLSSYRRGRSLREIGKMVQKSGRRSIILAKKVLGSIRGRSTV